MRFRSSTGFWRGRSHRRTPLPTLRGIETPHCAGPNERTVGVAISSSLTRADRVLGSGDADPRGSAAEQEGEDDYRRPLRADGSVCDPRWSERSRRGRTTSSTSATSGSSCGPKKSSCLRRRPTSGTPRRRSTVGSETCVSEPVVPREGGSRKARNVHEPAGVVSSPRHLRGIVGHQFAQGDLR
jgi:hypothetical protein